MSGERNVDPELRRLLIQEMRRHLPTLESGDAELCRRSLHALKGSAGLADEPELAAALQRLERRVRDVDVGAIGDAPALVRSAIERLESGLTATGSAWPEPPIDLLPATLDPLIFAQYAAEIADRLRGIDDALAASGDPIEAATTAYRHVHTMKGAASAVGDEPMSWFCHGLEDRLRTAGTVERASAALQELGHWRTVLGGLLEDAGAALRLLRGQPPRTRVTPLPPAQGLDPMSGDAAAARASPLPPRPGSNRPEEGETASARSVHADDATIRVQTAAVDRLLDEFVAIGLARERISTRGERTGDHVRKMRGVRAALGDALRLIGPPRPWGAPAAALTAIRHAIGQLAAIGDDLELGVGELRSGDLALRDAVTDAKRELSMMRQTPLKHLFARLATAVEAEARRAGREVVVHVLGAEETVDRRLADLLVEPCLQIARNAVAHGIETPHARIAAGKAPTGAITLAARRTGHRLTVTVADDGAGVDVAAVRRRAIDTGAVAATLAEAADDDTLLALLFLHGFSTRETSDLLAGRGIGLDIALNAVQRLGGALRLSSRYGEGFSARVEVPVESGLASVLWVTAAGMEYAVSATNALAVRRGEAVTGALAFGEPPRVPHLAACLEARSNEPAALALELGLEDDEPPYIVGVDDVGRTEEVLVRPLTPLVATMGPYAGAVVRDDGSLRLALDVYGLAPRARALARLPEARSSLFPSERAPRGA